MRCSGFLATSSPLSISISISITLPHTDPPWKKGKKETWAHEPILNNPEKTDEGFPSHSQPALSLHLFLCRLSVLIRPSVIPAPISCFLSHIPASLVFSYPSSLLVWRKDNEWLSFTALSLSLSLSLSLIRLVSISQTPPHLKVLPPCISHSFSVWAPPCPSLGYLQIYVCCGPVSVCSSKWSGSSLDSEDGVCVVTHVLLTLHWAKEEQEMKTAWQMEGQTKTTWADCWGGDSWVMCWRGVETMLCEMRISTPEWTQEKKDNNLNCLVWQLNRCEKEM